MPAGDDLKFTLGNPEPVVNFTAGQWFALLWDDWAHRNGRLADAVLRLALRPGHGAFTVLNPVVLTLLGAACALWLGALRGQRVNPTLLALGLLGLPLVLSVWPRLTGDTALWAAGAVNYLWPTVAVVTVGVGHVAVLGLGTGATLGALPGPAGHHGPADARAGLAGGGRHGSADLAARPSPTRRRGARAGAAGMAGHPAAAGRARAVGAGVHLRARPGPRAEPGHEGGGQHGDLHRTVGAAVARRPGGAAAGVPAGAGAARETALLGAASLANLLAVCAFWVFGHGVPVSYATVAAQGASLGWATTVAIALGLLGVAAGLVALGPVWGLGPAYAWVAGCAALGPPLVMGLAGPRAHLLTGLWLFLCAAGAATGLAERLPRPIRRRLAAAVLAVACLVSTLCFVRAYLGSRESQRWIGQWVTPQVEAARRGELDLIRLPSPMPQPDYAYHGSYNVNSYEDELLKVYGLPGSFVLENARPEEIEADPTIIALPR